MNINCVFCDCTPSEDEIFDINNDAVEFEDEIVEFSYMIKEIFHGKV